jgi:hypothetical protein
VNSPQRRKRRRARSNVSDTAQTGEYVEGVRHLPCPSLPIGTCNGARSSARSRIGHSWPPTVSGLPKQDSAGAGVLTVALGGCGLHRDPATRRNTITRLTRSVIQKREP